jgi:Leucine-rich repeat (LRR) protein
MFTPRTGECKSLLILKVAVGTSLGNALNKLDLSGNHLDRIPTPLIQNLPVLKTLDLSQCGLYLLPDQWHLPKLTKLNLSQNRFMNFPKEERICAQRKPIWHWFSFGTRQLNELYSFISPFYPFG